MRRVLVLGLAIAASAVMAGCHGPAPVARDELQEGFRQDDLTADEAQGHEVFLARCATCHGPEGRGDGQNAYNLDPPPPDFRESLAKLPAAERRRVVLGGTAAIGRSALCPPSGRSLSPEEVDAVVAWLDAVSRRPPEVPAGDGARSRWKRR